LQIEEADLREQQQSNAIWQRAENVYATETRAVGDMGSLRSMRPFELRSKLVFRDLSENLALFLIDALNFDQTTDGRYRYEWILDSGSGAIHSPSGRCITVNENYLRRHPVYASNGTPAIDQLDHDPFVQNILVPLSFSTYESEILQIFLEQFYFNKVVVANLYNREFGLPMETTSIEQLHVNIIYVKDDAQYFTYNPRLASTTQNLITDPIVIVDMFNVDASFYYSWLSHSAFFESTSANPFDEFRPDVVSHQMGSVLSNVNPVHALRAESIREMEMNIRILQLVRLVLIVAFVFSVYLFHASYYEQYQYPFCIKRIFGYSLMRINGLALLLGTCLTAAILLLFPIAWYFMLAIVAFDILIMLSFNAVLGKKTFALIVKGGH